MTDNPHTIRGWCRSCGAGADGAGRACAGCGASLDPPVYGPERVGRVVLRGNRLLRRPVVAVAVHDRTVLVMESDAEPVAVPSDEFDVLQPVRVQPAGASGAAGRLWAAAAACAAGRLKARWPASAADDAGSRLAGTSLGARRGAAVDLAAMGLPRRRSLQLSDSEWAWYEGRAAALRVDLTALLARLEELPSTGYLARVDLLMLCIEGLARSPDLAQRAAIQLAPFSDSSLHARALLSVLNPDHARHALPILRQYARHVGADAATADAIHTLNRYEPADEDGPRVRALAAYLNGVGRAAPVPSTVLRALKLPLIDRLVTAGAITQVPVQDDQVSEQVRVHLRCRLEPQDTDEATLAAAGFIAEAARNAYLSGDDAALERLPGDHDAVRHYRALRAYAQTGHLEEEELRPATRAALRRADELSMTFPVARPVPEQVAADPSTWPRIRANVITGKVFLDDRVRAAYPKFGLWVDLCRMHGLLYAGRWSETLRTGESLARSAAGDRRIHAAALNLMAYAAWQRGQIEQAAGMLDHAMTLRSGIAGLAVNAALVADSRGGLAALPYLAQVVQLTGDNRLRHTALLRAVELWKSSDATVAVPATLVRMIRSGLRMPVLDNDLRYTLLEIALRYDSQWLRTEALPPQPATRFFQSRAAVQKHRTAQTMKDAALALRAVWVQQPRPTWASQQRDWLVNELVEAMSDTYDPATDPAAALVALTNGSVLDLVPKIVLTAQAGLRTVLAENGATPPEDAVKRLLFAPVQWYRDELTSMSAADRNLTAKMLARAVDAALAGVANRTIRAWNELATLWQRLDRSTPLTWHENQQFVKRRRTAIDGFERELRRCRRYQALAEGLPVDRPLQDEVDKLVQRLSVQVSRMRRFLA